MAPVVKNLPANAGDSGSISGWGNSPGGGNGTHSDILTWRIHGHCSLAENGPWGSQKVRHDWSDLAHTHMHNDFLITFITPANSVLTIFPAITVSLHPFQPPPATYSQVNASNFGLLLQKHCTSLYWFMSCCCSRTKHPNPSGLKQSFMSLITYNTYVLENLNWAQQDRIWLVFARFTCTSAVFDS